METVTQHLNDRERLILRSIVHNYILTADPVGSRTLAKRYHPGLSPATIRNIMADMEEMGLLEHPHTSAGRVPTSLGYRLYVDDLMMVEELSEAERLVIGAKLELGVPEATEVLDQVTGLLAEVSRLLAFILAPDISAVKLEKVELVRVAAGRLMVVIVVSGGLVRTIMVELASPLTDADITAAGAFINSRLAGMKLADIPRQITQRLAGDSRAANSIVRLFLDFPDRIFSADARTEVHIGGTRQVLEQQEFRDPDRIKGIIELIEDRDVIVHLLKDRLPGVSVTIGEENGPEQLRSFSVITSTYRHGDATGTVGIIGPTRMNYSKLVALVDYTARLVGERSA
jgi:heat-inducible transcriptional repressor